MFEQTFVGGGQTKKPFTVLLAFVLQIVLIIIQFALQASQ